MKTPKLLLPFLAATAFLSTSTLSAATTDPVGYVTLDVAAGTGTEKSTNILSIPLLTSAESITGSAVGVITGITANSIQVSDANWGAGELSNAATPYLLRVTSGSSEGMTLVISTSSANTATEVFINNQFSGETLDLTTLGIVAATDTYEILPADTISSLFGTPATTGVLGGTQFSNADSLVIFNGGWQTYFYSTSAEGWVKSIFGLPSADNVVIHPDYSIIYERLADQSASFVVTGSVPTTSRSVAVNDTGITFLANGWPVDTTLETSGIQNIPGWVSGASAAASDQVIIRNNLGWATYFHDGTKWVRSIFGLPNANAETLPTGAGVIVDRIGTGGGLLKLTQAEPYTL